MKILKMKIQCDTKNKLKVKVADKKLNAGIGAVQNKYGW